MRDYTIGSNPRNWKILLKSCTKLKDFLEILIPIDVSTKFKDVHKIFAIFRLFKLEM